MDSAGTTGPVEFLKNVQCTLAVSINAIPFLCMCVSLYIHIVHLYIIILYK